MIDKYKNREEIMINNRIVPREYLTEISKYKINLTENPINYKPTLEKKLTKK